MPSTFDALSKSADRKVRKLLGRSYLRENRLEDALQVYQSILQDYPDESDIIFIFAELYRLSGSPETARRLYAATLAQDPSNLLAEKQLSRLAEALMSGVDEAEPLQDEALDRLAQRLQGENGKEQQAAIRGVAEMLENIRADEPQVSNKPPQNMQQLLPALINLNIRQARVAGQPELAEALQSLHIQLTRFNEEE